MSNYKIYWRFYGDSSYSCITVTAYNEKEALGIASRSLNNHMIQLSTMGEI